MKIKVNGIDFKKVLEKVTTVTNKKSIVALPRGIYFKAEGNKITAYATDLEQYLEVYIDGEVIEEGTAGIEVDDLKVIAKLNTDITLTTETMEADLELAFGKKKVTVRNYVYEVPEMENKEEVIIITSEASWLKETLTKLATFTAEPDAPNKMMSTINLNTKDGRAEAIDGYRIGLREFGNREVVTETAIDNCMIRNIAVIPMKKVLTEGNVTVSLGNKFLKIQGRDFTYYQRIFEGKYYEVARMLNNSYTWKLTTNTNSFAEVMKYNGGLLKGTHKPNILYINGNTIKSFAQCAKYEILDELEGEAEGEIMIGFNPLFMLDALNCVEAEEVEIYGNRYIDPLNVKADDYRFVILPINVNVDSENIKNKLAA